MQPSVAPKLAPEWGLAIKGVALIANSASDERVKNEIQQNKIPSVESFLGTNRTAAEYLSAIQQQDEKVRELHKKVCESMVNILFNTNTPFNQPVISLDSRTSLINIITGIERPNPLTKLSPTIQIAAIETIKAALQRRGPRN